MVLWMQTQAWCCALLLLWMQVLPCACDCDVDSLSDKVSPVVVPLTTFKEGDVLAYKCPPGYLNQKDVRNATCRGAQWELDTVNPLSCKGANCGAPGGLISLPHGRMSSAVFTFPHSVTFECNQGYRLHSDRGEKLSVQQVKLFCQSDGSWDGGAPQCKAVTCPDPSRDMVANAEEIDFDKLEFGGEVRYRCKRNYKLVGPASRRCLDSGVWSDEKPRCDVVTCSVPTLTYGRVIAVAGNMTNALPNEASVLYVCDNSNERRTVKCLPGGYWSANPPVCPGPQTSVKPKVTVASSTKQPPVMTSTQRNWQTACPPLSSPAYGKLFSADGFGVNASVIFSCDEGYVMRGPYNMTCRPGGVWDPPTPPTCYAPPPWIIILSVCLAGLATLVLCCVVCVYVVRRRRRRSPPAQGYRRQIRKPSPYDSRTRDEVTHLGKPFPVTSL